LRLPLQKQYRIVPEFFYLRSHRLFQIALKILFKEFKPGKKQAFIEFVTQVEK
jgi:hypothetical protein